MDKKVFELLNEIGVPCNLKGREYLEDAIKMALKSDNALKAMDLYERVAKKHKSTISKVERAIRTAVEVTFENTEPNSIKKVFGNQKSIYKGSLPSATFIFGASRYLTIYGS